MPGTEYLKLICDDKGNLQHILFYDNVRDFQGNNPVNRSISGTLNDVSQRDKFVVLNNGVTVVAQSISKVGSTFKLKDFQIVNGCQTSHMLHRNRAAAGHVFVPVKVIVTDDVDVTNVIVKGTNSQTAVLIEAFESLTPFQKELEEFYLTFGKDKAHRLFYERRSKQYESLPIKPSEIISLTAQVKSFVGMFLNEPQSTHRYYGELLEANRNRIFLPSHSPYLYYISGYALHCLERLFNSGKLDSSFKRYKHHLLMLFRIMREPSPLPYLNNKKEMDGYCTDMLVALSSKEGALATFEHALSQIRAALKIGGYDKWEADRFKAFTLQLIEQAAGGKRQGVATVEREQGKVKWFSDIKGYGFIVGEGQGKDIFVHYTDIRGVGYRTLLEGQRVEFTLAHVSKGLQANDVTVLAA